MSWDSVVLVQNHFLLVFVGGDNFKIVWPKFLFINFLHAIYELDGSCVTILGKKWYSIFTGFYSLKNSTDGLVNKKCILNFILRFLNLLTEQTFYHSCVIWLSFSIVLVLIIVLLVLILFSFLVAKLARHLGGIDGTILVFSFSLIIFLPKRQTIIAQFSFNVQLV